jgi:hypothetical protein
MFVLNEQVLKDLVKGVPGRVQVLSGTYDEYFVSIAYRIKNRSANR